jgi:hypothetical protein
MASQGDLGAETEAIAHTRKKGYGKTKKKKRKPAASSEKPDKSSRG